MRAREKPTTPAERQQQRFARTLAAVVFVLGFLLVTAVSTARAQRREEAPRRAQLVRLIESRRSQLASLDADVARLRADVAAAQEAAAERGAADQQDATRAARLALEAGTVDVRGRGLVVTLDHSTREPDDPDEEGAYRIHDRDVQLVVNALFLAGAEAVAVNGSRVVATTPIRAAGDTIVVNFRPVSPPFRVAAIGADRARFDDAEISRRFRRWRELFGLRFDVAGDDDMRIAAYTGRVGISSAAPVVDEAAPADAGSGGRR